MINQEIKDLNKQLQETELSKRTKGVFDKIWNMKNPRSGNILGDEFRYLFGLRLFQYAYGKHYDYTTKMLPVGNKSERTEILKSYRGKNISSSLAKQFHRLSIGYNSLTYEFTPYRCSLSSEKANKEDPKETTKDHIIGATLSARYAIYVFQNGEESEKKDWKNMKWLGGMIDYMCNEWLKDNLWLWAQCRVTKVEHNKQIKRNYPEDVRLAIMDRANLLHYDRANVKVCDYIKRRKGK